MRTVRVAAAQTPEFREDVAVALAYAAEVARLAKDVALLCFPEGFLQGYLTEEASARRHALDLGSAAFGKVIKQLPADGPAIVMGLIEIDEGRLFNTAAVIAGGRLIGRYRKTHLLSGERFFEPGTDNPVFEAAGLRFGINICADTNFPQAAAAVAGGGASLLVCPANNMHRRQTSEKWRDVHNAVRGERCRETGLWLLSADVTGERDDRICWGPTAVLTPEGAVAAQLPLDAPGLLVFDIPCPP